MPNAKTHHSSAQMPRFTHSGIKKKVTTHVPRKGAGTHMAKENPRLAREQLGITQKVFEKHYNQPTVGDRIEHRDLVLGAQPTPRTTWRSRVP